jgi:quercetin dioxygenase-like cupin family protein
LKIEHIKNFKNGWFIGDFLPSILRVKDFEVGVVNHKKGEFWPVHYHKVATEYNLILKGTMIIQGKTLTEGDMFILAPNEIADPIFLTDCQVLVIKTPSVPGDKYIVDSISTDKGFSQNEFKRLITINLIMGYYNV